MILLHKLDFSLYKTNLRSYGHDYQRQSSIALPLAKR